MKYLVCPFIAFFTALSLCVSFVARCADGESWEDVIKDTIFTGLIQKSEENGNGFPSLIRHIGDRILYYSWLNATKDNNDNLQFSIPNYDVLTGKYMLHYVLDNDFEDDVLVECTALLSDTPAALPALPSVTVAVYGDIYYYANALNFTITRTDGDIKRYVVTYPAGFNYTSPIFSNSSYSIGAQSGCTVYEYRGGENVTNNRPIKTNVRMNVVRFNTSTVNSIRKNLSDLYTPSSLYNSKPAGFYGSNSGISASAPISYPSDIDIVLGSVGAVYMASSGSGSSNIPTFNWNTEFMCSFATTNNPQKGNQLNTRWTTPQTQNYYYNDYIQGGTTINETNVNNYFDGAFLPAFDIDPDLPLDDIIALLTDLAPDFQLAMRPTLDLSTGALFDRLVDFYGNMPDINLDWDTPLDNDYWDIEFPPIPDSGGGGSGGDITVTVDITRPLVPQVVTTYWLDLDVGTQTTVTYPVALVSAAPQVFDKADEVVDTLEIMPLIGLLAVFGVAVSILFKGV